MTLVRRGRHASLDNYRPLPRAQKYRSFHWVL